MLIHKLADKIDRVCPAQVLPDGCQPVTAQVLPEGWQPVAASPSPAIHPPLPKPAASQPSAGPRTVVEKTVRATTTAQPPRTPQPPGTSPQSSQPSPPLQPAQLYPALPPLFDPSLPPHAPPARPAEPRRTRRRKARNLLLGDSIVHSCDQKRVENSVGGFLHVPGLYGQGAKTDRIYGSAPSDNPLVRYKENH